MDKAKIKGHEIKSVNGVWYFCATGLRVCDYWKGVSCGHCGKDSTKEGHDGCLGELKGIMNACCGHGRNNVAYVQFLDRSVVRGDSALIILNELKNAVNIQSEP